MVVGRKADYVLASKVDRRSLCADAELIVAKQKAAGFKHTTAVTRRWMAITAGSRRTPTTVIHDVALAAGTSQLAAAGMRWGLSRAEREIGDKVERGDPIYLIHHIPGAAGDLAGSDRTESLGDRKHGLPR